MAAALGTVIQANGWEWATTWVWVDVTSIRQKARAMQAAAVNSLSSYGSGHMWIATSPTACTKLCEVTATEGHSDLVQSYLRVFDGEAIVASDKLSLVLPVLGLYAGLLVRSQQNKKNQLPALLAALDAQKVLAASANQTAMTVDVIEASEDRHASGEEVI